MFKLAELFVEIGARTGSLDRTLAGVRSKIAGFAAMRFALPMGGLSGMLLGAGGVYAVNKAVGAASDLQETVSKVNQVFGESAGKVTTFADGMNQAFGVPRKEIMDAAAGIGLVGKGAGYSADKAADLGVNMARLAADASSFYNVPVDVALEKIRAGLVGESEPLRAFGVMLSEDAVKAQALAMGLASSSEKLTESAKVQARAALIAKGLADATGDLERTSGGYANQTRKLWGNLQTLAENIGTALMPAFNSLIHLVNDVTSATVEGFDAQTSAIGKFSTYVASGIDTVALAYENWGDVIERTGVMVGGWAMNIGDYAAYFKDVMIDAFKAVMSAGGNFAANVADLMAEVYRYLTSGFDDPIEVKFRPLLEGFESSAKLQLRSVEDQLAEIDDRLFKRAQSKLEAAEAKDRAARERAAIAKAMGGGVEAGVPTKAEAAEYLNASSYTSKIQAAATSANGKVPEQQLAEQKKTNDLLNDIKTGFKGMKPAVASFA